MDINNTLKERGERYGAFIDNARIAQDIKEAMRKGNKWESLDPDMKEGLDMVASKVSRILTGDPQYVDSWHDIIGFTKLVENRLESLKKDYSIGVIPVTHTVQEAEEEV